MKMGRLARETKMTPQQRPNYRRAGVGTASAKTDSGILASSEHEENYFAD
jgi:hypothetical protein